MAKRYIILNSIGSTNLIYQAHTIVEYSLDPDSEKHTKFKPSLLYH